MRLVKYSLLLLLAGCATSRPDTDLCGINALAGHKKCYNLKNDYDEEGNLKHSATPKIIPINSINDLNKNICTDPQGFENLNIYLQQAKQAYKECLARPGE